jgi:acyl transferase domain-containing protein
MSKSAWMFPGQGAYYAGALSHTRLIYPRVRDRLEVVEAVGQRRYGRSLSSVMWTERRGAAELLQTDPALLQLAIYALSISACELLLSEGVQPDVLLGHSFGEIAALTCGGAFSVEHGAEIVCDRIESLSEGALWRGSMAAITANREKARSLLVDFTAKRNVSSLVIAVENHAGQTVISGPTEAALEFAAYCTANGSSAQILNAPYAFHHPGLAQASEIFAKRLQSYAVAQLRFPVYSPITGRFYRRDDPVRELLAQHFVQPVHFQSALQAMHETGVTTFIECGALNALTKIAIRSLGLKSVRAFATLEGPENELDPLRKITNHYQKEQAMLATHQKDKDIHDFETFWAERCATLMAQLKSECQNFVAVRNALHPEAVEPVAKALLNASVLTVVPALHVATAYKAISRDQLYHELVSVYATAMEYPIEVFSDSVELEAELGIDSVKQTEIIGRISADYNLPPLPEDFRSGDFKTMGQIVDFVFKHQGTTSSVS